MKPSPPLVPLEPPDVWSVPTLDPPALLVVPWPRLLPRSAVIVWLLPSLGRSWPVALCPPKSAPWVRVVPVPVLLSLPPIGWPLIPPPRSALELPLGSADPLSLPLLWPPKLPSAPWLLIVCREAEP